MFLLHCFVKKKTKMSKNQNMFVFTDQKHLKSKISQISTIWWKSMSEIIHMQILGEIITVLEGKFG